MSTYSDTSHTTSCSDCKLEEIQKKWTKLLLNWLNKCVHPKAQITKLNHRSLADVITKYKQDICDNDVDRALLCSDDVEPFIRYKYPILRLKNICEERDYYRKHYILTAVLLFHCCVSSIDGLVDSDICAHLEKHEQEMILKYCERLTDMEVTANNVETAIKDACDAVNTVKTKKKGRVTILPEKPLVIGSGESCLPSDSVVKESPVPSLTSDTSQKRIKFKSSVTVLPSVVIETSSFSDVDYVVNYGSSEIKDCSLPEETLKRDFVVQSNSSEFKHRCLPDCACSRCSQSGPCCGDPGSSMADCFPDNITTKEYEEDEGVEKASASLWDRYKTRFFFVIGLIALMALLTTLALILKKAGLPPVRSLDTDMRKIQEKNVRSTQKEPRTYQPNSFVCRKELCQKVYQPTSDEVFLSYSRCVLQCMGPQLWPFPIGFTYYSKKIVALATNKLEYKFQSIPSEAVSAYLSEAFKLFIENLSKMEKYNADTQSENVTKDIYVRKMFIQIDVESDPDPRLKVNTDESYTLKVDAINANVIIKIASPSFCGVRHGLETLSQLILPDQTTGYLITLSNVVIKDAPSYKYRGLMIDTGRNYIPVSDLMRTIDAMSSCKLNTLHWRISDATSFPLLIPSLPQLYEYGAYSKSMVYTKDDVKAIVNKASIRGIRILLEVAVPGPVGRAWSWSTDVSCPSKTENYTCNNVLCLRLAMKESVMDMLQTIYSEIIDMTKVDDIFHLSDGLFSMVNCYYLIEEREGFLDKALERLKLANKGFLPKLPIIWYTAHLAKDYEAKAWDRLGVQLTVWQPNPSDQFLGRFKVIHSSKWDLSCEVKKQRCRKYRTWQDMYSWKSWRNIEAFTIEGGETLLWTDLVDSGNLDYHLWPRVAAVAERLWSDISINGSVTPSVYVRLDSHRWRMTMKTVKVQPIWPVYCSYNPVACIQQLNPHPIN